MLLAATSENLLPPKKITQSENSKMSQTEWSLGSNQAPKIYDYGEKSITVWGQITLLLY